MVLKIIERWDIVLRKNVQPEELKVDQLVNVFFQKNSSDSQYLHSVAFW